MGLKKGKYVYVEIAPGRYVKVREIKSKASDSPSKYRVVSKITTYLPATAKVVKLENIPEPARKSIVEQLSA